MTEYSFNLDMPEEPESYPDWYDKSVKDAIGFDSYDNIPDIVKDADLETLQAFRDGVKKDFAKFKGTLTTYNATVGEADNELAKLENQYLTLVRKIAAAKNMSQRVIENSKPKTNAFERRIDQAERLIVQKLAAQKAEEEWNNLLEEWAKLAKEMPWAGRQLDHQDIGAQRMAMNRTMILADVMGLGKTFTSIMACDYIKAKTAEGDIEKPAYDWQEPVNHPPAGRKILYLCPAQLATNVQDEYKKWAEHRGAPLILTGVPRNARRILMNTIKNIAGDYVVLLNYEAWRKDKSLITDLIECEFDTVILDEAHSLKERDSIGYRGVFSLLNGLDFQNENTKDINYTQRLHYDKPRFVFPMTGTPILNRPQEFYTLMTLVQPNVYPNTNEGEQLFLNNYCEQYAPGKWRFRKGGLDELAKKISNMYLRRTLKDAGIKLPPQTPQLHELEIDEDAYPLQANARRAMRDHALLMMDTKVEGKANAAITLILRLRQIETLPRGIKIKVLDEEGEPTGDEYQFQVDESQKLDYIIKENGQGYVGLLPEICPDQRTVIYSQFKEPLHELKDRCEAAGLRVAILDGDTPKPQREIIQKDVDRYFVEAKAEAKGHETIMDDDYEYDVVLCNYKVGGQGLNLTHITQTIILDEEWNPGKRDQAYGRTHRIGQTEDTTVHIIRVKESIDPWMANLIAVKESDVDSFNLATDFIKGLRNGEF